jgi:sugar/nucleoside kinase (ribokinase family)
MGIFMNTHRVACIGDLLVEIMRPEVGARLDKPGTFLGPYPSGASGIFIDTIARLGLDARFIGAVGNDDFGSLIIHRLRDDGVDISKIKVLENYTTGVAFVTYFEDGSRKFIFHLADAATGQIYPEDVDPDYLSDLSYLHIIGSTLATNKNCADACFKAVEYTLKNGGKISFDPNFRPELISEKKVREYFEPILRKCHIIFPTEEEIKVLTGKENIDQACEETLSSGPEIVAIKQGRQGSSVYTKDDKFTVPAFSVEEIDPTGAGDCYCAGFISGFLNELSLRETARFANAVGAMAVTKKGPMEGAPTSEKVIDFLAGSSFSTKESNP